MRRRTMTRGGSALALVAMAFAATPAAHAATPGPPEPVIVEATSTATATAAVEAVGGKIDLVLALVGGVSAHVTPDGLAALEANPNLRVVPDATLHPTSGSFRAASSGTGVDPQISALDPPSGWSADAGRGVAVALVDTGVSDTPDLHGAAARYAARICRAKATASTTTATARSWPASSRVTGPRARAARRDTSGSRRPRPSSP